MKQYVINKETNKIELRFDKADYKALPDTDKKEIKRYFLFASSRSAWVSRSTNNHYSAIRIAEKLGFTDGGETGERLSYAEQIERQIDRAEARAERMEYRADKAIQKAEHLQSGWKEARKDWSYVTQPVIVGHSGSERFARQRQRVLDRYTKGFDEYRRSADFRDKADTARGTASMAKFGNRTYLSNRIKESNKRMKRLESLMIKAEEQNNEKGIARALELMEAELDKLAYLQNCLDVIGGVKYSRENLKKGYLVLLRGYWATVVKANPKTVEVKYEAVPYTLKYDYAEIKEMKIPEDWTEEKNDAINPFEVGDIVVNYLSSSKIKQISYAFQIVRKTTTSVYIQKINIENNEPIKDSFVGTKQGRKAVKQDRNKTFVLHFDYGYLYPYKAIDEPCLLS